MQRERSPTAQFGRVNKPMPAAPEYVGSPDERADGFEAFYRDTCSRTFRAAYRMSAGNQHLACDVVQDAYLAMLRRWPDRRERLFEANRRYVLGIVSKKIVDWYRARDNNCSGLDDVDCQADEPTPADMLGEWAVLNGVRNLLEGQPVQRRAVGMLFFLEDWEPREIATALDMDASTVRTHIHRLRGLLKPLIHRMNDLDPGGDQR